jgi:hypothetical protein
VVFDEYPLVIMRKKGKKKHDVSKIEMLVLVGILLFKMTYLECRHYTYE